MKCELLARLREMGKRQKCNPIEMRLETEGEILEVRAGRPKNEGKFSAPCISSTPTGH